jgi:hypothetical protein
MGEWVKVIEPDKAVDLFSEQGKITFFNRGRIQPGEYINFKLLISESIRVSEADHFGNMTKEGGYAVLSGTARDNFELPGNIKSYLEKSPTWNDQTEGMMTQVINFDNEDADDIIELTKVHDFARPILIKNGSFVNVVFSLNLLGTCYKVNPSAFKRGMPKKRAMVVFPPRYADQVRFTVDQKTELLEADDVLIKF